MRIKFPLSGLYPLRCSNVIMDEETGELNFDVKIDGETGESVFYAFSVDGETGEKIYCTLADIWRGLRINPVKISRYTTNTPQIQKLKPPPSSQRHMEFITAIVFLIPTFIIFTPLLGVVILTFDVILHRWCHRQNTKLNLRRDSTMYYQSPLRMLYKEFCSKCVAEEDCRKMQKIQLKRRRYIEEGLRRVVA